MTYKQTMKQKSSPEDRRNFKKAGFFLALAIAILVVGWQRTSASLDATNGARTASACEGKNALDHAACRRNSTGQ